MFTASSKIVQTLSLSPQVVRIRCFGKRGAGVRKDLGKCATFAAGFPPITVQPGLRNCWTSIPGIGGIVFAIFSTGSSLPTAPAVPPVARTLLKLVQHALAAAIYRKPDSFFTEVGATLLRSEDSDVVAGHADKGPRSPNVGALPLSWHCTYLGK